MNFEKLLIDYNINTIINFAAQTHVDNSYNSLNQFIKDNIITVGVILEAMRNHQKKFNNKIALIATSSGGAGTNYTTIMKLQMEYLGCVVMPRSISTNDSNPLNIESTKKILKQFIDFM